MAQRLPKLLVAGEQMTTSAATYYTTPANTLTTISAATASNDTGTPRTLTLHIVPSGGTASSANKIGPALTVPAGLAIPIGILIGHTMPAGTFVQGLSDAGTAVTLFVSGYETNP